MVNGKRRAFFEGIKWRLMTMKDALRFLFFTKLLLVALGLIVPVAYQLFVDQILGRGIYGWKWPFFSILFGTAMAVGLMTWLERSFLNRLSIRNAVRFSTQFLWHTLRLPVQFFSQHFGGESINRMAVNGRVAASLSSQFIPVGIALLLVMIYGIIMVQYDVAITLIALGGALVSLITMRRGFIAAPSLQQEQVRTLGISLDTLQQIETIKASSDEGYFFSRIAGHITKNINALQKIGRKDAWLSSFAQAIESFSIALLLSVGVWRVLHGHLTVGMLLALQVLLLYFLAPFSKLLNFTVQFHSLKADLSRLDDLLQHPIDPLTEEGDSARLSGQVVFQNVVFGYRSADLPVIRHLSIKIEPGQSVALVGPIGSGKSTVVRLLCGLCLPWEGEILYDGKPLAAYSPASRSRSIAAVDQNVFLFEGTVRDNLALWDSTIPDEQVMAAAKAASIHEVILNRAGGYRALLIEDGRNFSEGERQQLEIARALVGAPSLLIMDGATSALDSETERELMANLKKMRQTTLLITQSLSVIRDCDQVLVLDKGVVVQQGTHETLYREGGLYRSLLGAEEESHG